VVVNPSGDTMPSDLMGSAATLQGDPTDALEPQYALKVSVDTCEGRAVPADLWTPRHIREVLDLNELPEPFRLNVLDSHTFLWLCQDPRTLRGLSEMQAADMRQVLRRVDVWHGGEVEVRMDAIPIPIQAVERLTQRDRGFTRRPISVHSDPGPRYAPSTGSAVTDESDMITDIEDLASNRSYSTRRGRGFIRQVPKIATFTGDSDGDKGRSYFEWRFDVESLLEAGYEPAALRAQVIFSLKGAPGIRARQLGVSASVREIIDHLDLVYQEVRTYDELTRALYNVTQGLKETVPNYEQRLEYALARIRQAYPERCAVDHMEDCRRERFFQGLRLEIRNGIRYLYNRDPKVSYARLLTAAREAEQEGNTRAPLPPAKDQGRKPWNTATLRHQSATLQVEEEVPGQPPMWDDSTESREPDGGTAAVGDPDDSTKAAALKYSQQASKLAERQFLDAAKKAKNGEISKDACFRCGELGHYARECPTNVRPPLNGKGGGARKNGPPPPKAMGKATTATNTDSPSQ